MNRSRRQWIAATGVAAAAAAGGAVWGWSRYRTAAPEPEAAPDLWSSSFPGPEGKPPLAMAALRGKPLVLNFWATWCAPCVKEMPQFERFHREYAARGWQVAGLAIDNAAAVAQFLQRTPVSYPIGVAGMDGAELMLALGNTHGALPFTLVFDAQGRVTQQRLGETGYEELVHWAA